MIRQTNKQVNHHDENIPLTACIMQVLVIFGFYFVVYWAFVSWEMSSLENHMFAGLLFMWEVIIFSECCKINIDRDVCMNNKYFGSRYCLIRYVYRCFMQRKMQ